MPNPFLNLKSLFFVLLLGSKTCTVPYSAVPVCVSVCLYILYVPVGNFLPPPSLFPTIPSPFPPPPFTPPSPFPPPFPVPPPFSPPWGKLWPNFPSCSYNSSARLHARLNSPFNRTFAIAVFYFLVNNGLS